ncbi:FecR family protein [Mangrovivirga sp. M17]|uniref:FecR family protein n=1 Tax=Mangrovivirga halotolerans TaxID=2993936 RepID=A0ABT3RR96_9BACT|nr:FecR family protein [Mangrovivirga halotolerans]MCX2744102.1 FecR family protein [Mangrovivirga halotolerans]
MSEKYIEKWLNGELSEQEKQEFENSPEFESLKKLTSSIEKFKAPELDKEKEWERIKATIYDNSNEKSKKSVQWFPTFIKVAAAIAIIATAYIYFFTNNITTISTSVAEKKTVVLPDSSIVILNSLSSITYDDSNWDNQREVKMEGEALFTVKKGSKFEVKSSSGTIKVLGTEFNVRERGSLFEVICYEGLVQVNKGNEEVRLTSNKIFSSLAGKSSVKEKATGITPHLASNESAFYSVPFKEVLNEFERQYQVDISSKNIDLQRDFTGKFTHTDIDLALKSITVPLDLSYKINGGKVILSKK